jgi:predicted small secreted protein
MMTLRSLCLVALAAPLLAACNTVDGVGQDVSAVGKGVSHVAVEVKEEVFGPDKTSRRFADSGAVRNRNGTARAGRACDPTGNAINDTALPPCRSQNYEIRPHR